jgi:hypothetical protein
MGFALRMRWLWSRKIEDKPWLMLPDKPEAIEQDVFYYSTTVTVGDGAKTLFWKDRWINGQSIAELAPSLINVVGPRTRNIRTVKEALQHRSWVRDIKGALTVQVILDYLLIWDLMEDVTFTEASDKVVWRWTKDGRFSTASAYRAFFSGQHAIPGARLLHKSRAPAKCKFFIWLALHDRCWTAARRKSHRLQDDDSCALCDQESKSITHLLIACPYTREVWFTTLSRWGWGGRSPHGAENCLADWWEAARRRLHKQERRALDSLVILVCWNIWLERNARIFSRRQASPSELRMRILEHLADWSSAGFQSISILVHTLLGRTNSFV